MDLKFALIDDDGIKKMEGEAEATLRKNKVHFKTKKGETLEFKYKNMEGIEEKDHNLDIDFFNKTSLSLSNLGYKFKGFSERLRAKRNKKILKLLLMEEGFKDRFEGEFGYIGVDRELKGDGEFRIYETGLVVIHSSGELFRIPYGDITEVNEEEYTIEIKTGIGEKLDLKKLGRAHKKFIDEFREAFSQLSENIQSELRELSKLSDIDAYELSEISKLMRDGRAVSEREIKDLSSNLWRALMNSLDDVGLEWEYNFLTSLSEVDETSIGVKRGLMGDLTKQYVWLLVPILNTDKEKLGNAVVMESSSNGTGKATYIFRAMEKSVYAETDSLSELKKTAQEFIKKMNRAMMDINFRREPIYLNDDKLEKKRYRKYKFAVQRMPSLRFLRQNYLGRVFHRSKDQWKQEVEDILVEAC
ncbi:hypothetical protein C9439_01875 [archaeon SCG-AAA382B04]|nr:hypothetical protein C9439_01875 [archaeon SCG-AAA382B04]